MVNYINRLSDGNVKYMDDGTLQVVQSKIKYILYMKEKIKFIFKDGKYLNVATFPCQKLEEIKYEVLI